MMKFFASKIVLATTENYRMNPRVIVPASAGNGITEERHNIRQPSGAPIRGTPIPWHHESIPDMLYHVTPRANEVRNSGVLMAGGKGGLGGDDRDQMVSMTVNPDIAHSLKRDMQNLSRAARHVGPEPEHGTPERAAWSNKLRDFFHNEAQRQGWNWGPGTDTAYANHSGYNFNDWASNFHIFRDFAMDRENHPEKHKYHNPIFMGAKQDYWSKIDPDNVDIIQVPKHRLNSGSLVTDFDLGRGALDEVRHYGDIPL